MIEVARRERTAGVGSRPLLPSRAIYWLWFGLSAILVFGMFAYLVWARARSLLSWTEVWTIEGNYVVGGGICLTIGLFFRWRWLKKKDAIRSYEQMLSSIAATNGS